MRQVSPKLFALQEQDDPGLVEQTRSKADDYDLIVCGPSSPTAPPLPAALFLTERGLRRLGEPHRQFGELAPLDLWFRASAEGASIALVKAEVHPAADLDPLATAEMVYRHLGYLPLRWASAIADGDPARSTDDYLQAYSYSVIAQDRLKAAIGDDADQTQRAIIERKLATADQCHRVATREEIDLEPYVPRKVGPQFWAFDRTWYRDQRAKWHGFVASEATDRRPYVIAGNGPSLRESLGDLAGVGSQTRLITSNFAALETSLMQSSHVHTVVNYLVAEQAAGLINLLPERVNVVVPFWLSYCIRPRPNVFFTETTADVRFSTDISKEVSWVHTVSFYAMQLGHGLSAGDVGLVGFDHSYNQPAVVEGAELLDIGPDTNHFRADYFSGRRWQAADTDMMETVYRLAADAYVAKGRRLVNCTVGGHLELFSRCELSDFVSARS